MESSDGDDLLNKKSKLTRVPMCPDYPNCVPKNYYGETAHKGDLKVYNPDGTWFCIQVSVFCGMPTSIKLQDLRHNIDTEIPGYAHIRYDRSLESEERPVFQMAGLEFKPYRNIEVPYVSATECTPEPVYAEVSMLAKHKAAELLYQMIEVYKTSGLLVSKAIEIDGIPFKFELQGINREHH